MAAKKKKKAEVNETENVKVVVEPALANVVAHPEDDSFRLVYADILQQRGDPLGEFIALQVALGKKAGLRYADFKARTETLLQSHRKAWVEPLEPLTRSVVFRRGFVDELHCSSKDFIKHGARVLQLAPITRLKLSPVTGTHLEQLAEFPFFGNIRNLAIQQGEELDEGLASFVFSDNAANLRNLNLTFCGIGLDAITAIATSPKLSQLTTLSLTANEVLDEGVQTLADSTTLTSLKTLYLSTTEITDDGLDALASSQLFGQLEKLCLNGNEFSANAAKKLAKKAAKGTDLKLKILEMKNMWDIRSAKADLQKAFPKALRM